MKGEDIAGMVVGIVVFYFIIFLGSCAVFFSEDSGEQKWKEDKEHYLLLGFWPITLVLLTPVILIGAVKMVWGFLGWIGTYAIGIKNLYKELVAR